MVQYIYFLNKFVFVLSLTKFLFMHALLLTALMREMKNDRSVLNIDFLNMEVLCKGNTKLVAKDPRYPTAVEDVCRPTSFKQPRLEFNHSAGQGVELGRAEQAFIWVCSKTKCCPYPW